MAKNNGRNLMVFAAVAILVMCVFNFFSGTRAGYTMTPLMQGENDNGMYASVNGSQGPMVDVCALKNGGTGLASALLPKEVATQEDFGQFAPDDILKGQNFLNPRDQIGFPETIGGALRNANQQVRSEPQNPRTPVTIFNNSTIEPDQMRPPFEIGSGLA
jgi:hypothetical protein